MTIQSGESNADDTNVSVKLANASRFPLVRRLDAHWNLESQLRHYDAEIRRVSGMNSSALASLEYQERRLRDLQSSLRSSVPSKTNSPQTTTSILQRDSKQRVDTEEDKDDQNDADTNAAVEEGACHQTKSTPNDSPFIERVVDVPDAPRNLRPIEVGRDSFTLIWDNADNDILDYEIKYSSLNLNEGSKKEVSMSCSRWCLKSPIPKGRFILENLGPNTKYHGIAIRRRNIYGWSGFSNHIQCLTTIAADENHLLRRSNFTKRISMLEQSIQRLEATKEQLPIQQASLARDMIQVQERVMALEKEIERVMSYDGSDLLSSHLLHGISQAFTKTALKRKLEKELTSCREHIALNRSEIIAIDKQIDQLSNKIVEQVNHLKERKAALQDFDRRNALVCGIRLVSEDPFDVKKYYLSFWRGQCLDQLAIKKTLELFVRLCKRYICAGAWRKLRGNGTTGQDVVDKNVYGIGGALLNLTKQNITATLADAMDLIGALSHAKEQCSGLCGADILTTNFPEELKESLTKGNFMFRAGNFASSLENFEQALSMIESRELVVGISTRDVAHLRAAVYGAIGHVEIKLERNNIARVHFDRQLSLAEEEDLIEQETCALMGLGLCYLQKYDYNFAETLLKRALDSCQTIGDKSNEILLYSYLERCYTGLNRHSEAAMYAAKIKASRESEGNAVAHNEVKSALQKLDCMLMRLGTAAQEAIASQVVKLEAISSHHVLLQKTLSKKEHELKAALERLAVTESKSIEAQNLIKQIEQEIFDAKNTKKSRFISRLLQGNIQEVNTATLIFRLEGELKIVRNKLDANLSDISTIKLVIHNTKDDIALLKEEIDVEGRPLMSHIQNQRTYRCACFNASNVVRDDIAGESANDRDWIALSEGQDCYIHRLRTGHLMHVFTNNEDDTTICSLHCHGDVVYTGSIKGTFVAWHVPSSNILFKTGKEHKAAITCIWADSSKLVTGSADKCIILWSTDGVLLHRLYGHSRSIKALICGSTRLVSASNDTIYVWDKQTATNIQEVSRRLVLNEGHVTSLHFCEMEVIVGDNLGSISVWWIDSGLELKKFKAHDGPVLSIQVDAVKAVSCGLDMTIVVSDVIKGQVLQTLRGHTARILAVAFGSKQIVSLSSDGEARHWFWSRQGSGQANQNSSVPNTNCPNTK